jgi:hypothetical protein
VCHARLHRRQTARSRAGPRPLSGDRGDLRWVRLFHSDRFDQAVRAHLKIRSSCGVDDLILWWGFAPWPAGERERLESTLARRWLDLRDHLDERSRRLWL